MAREKKGVYEDPRKTVEDLRAAYPFFRIEDCRADQVRFGNAFAHPEDEEAMSLDMSAIQASHANPETSNEQLKAERSAFAEITKATWDKYNEEHPEWEEYGFWEEYDVDGCPEDPDAPKVHVVVRRLRESYLAGPYPVIFSPAVGGLFLSDPYMLTNAPITKYLGCELVVPQIRTFPDAQYPAAINDLHATYQWMIAHAKELDIDPDRVVITGTSSSGHLAAALPFRLKRYGWCGGGMPRGVFTYDGFYDDRETTRSMRELDKGWDGLANRGANMRYMGENFASGFIGPEAYANHATTRECEGLPPYAIFEHQDCPGCDPAIEFMQKINEAGGYCSFLMSGGCGHTAPMEYAEQINLFNARETDYEPKIGVDEVSREVDFMVGNIKDFIQYDLRR